MVDTSLQTNRTARHNVIQQKHGASRPGTTPHDKPRHVTCAAQCECIMASPSKRWQTKCSIDDRRTFATAHKADAEGCWRLAVLLLGVVAHAIAAMYLLELTLPTRPRPPNATPILRCSTFRGHFYPSQTSHFFLPKHELPLYCTAR